MVENPYSIVEERVVGHGGIYEKVFELCLSSPHARGKFYAVYPRFSAIICC